MSTSSTGSRTDPHDVLSTPPIDEDLDQRLRDRKTRRVDPRILLGLSGVALLAVGLVGGIGLGRASADDATATGPGRQLPAAGQGFPGAAGQAPGGRAGGGTTGTVTAVDGANVTIEGTDGETTTVTTSEDTVVTLSDEAAVGDLQAGDTVVVQGETGDGGTVAATTIREGVVGSGAGLGGAGGPAPADAAAEGSAS